MNIDTKIPARVMAERLTKVLPDIISTEQLGFIKGRNIYEGNRLIDYIIEHLERTNKRGLIAAIDLEKAFDCISHTHIDQTMELLGFPEEFRHLFKTLYKNPELCVINNSRTTNYFPLGRSCRQGDPIMAIHNGH